MTEKYEGVNNKPAMTETDPKETRIKIFKK